MFPRTGSTRRQLIRFASRVLVGLATAFGLAAGTPLIAASQPGAYDIGPERVWIQVESHPDLQTTVQRARSFGLIYDHAAAFETTSGWYAIVIGASDHRSAGGFLANLKSNGAIPSDSLLTTGRTYLTRVWPPDSATGTGGLEAALAREQSWNAKTRRGLQNALVWTGDYAGVLDGEIGPSTRDAIRSFQRRNGFAGNGYLTGEQIALLEEQRVAAIRTAGFEVVEDLEAGLRIGIPTAVFERAGRDGYAVIYQSRTGQPEGTLLLLSSPGDPNDLSGMYQHLSQREGIGPKVYKVLRDDWFVISAQENGASTYMYARAEHGAIKGFILAWPEHLSSVFRPISVAMFNSLESIPGVVLHPSPDSRAPDDWEDRPLVEDDEVIARSIPNAGRSATAGPEPRETPSSEDALIGTGTGFAVDAVGHVLTNAHVIDGCAEVVVGEDIPAKVIAVDQVVDLALLHSENGAWSSSAQFAARPARLNSDVTVVGYPLHGLLGGINVTRGAVSAAAGLGNDAAHFQITAAVQPGNSGGPVLAPNGAVVGVVQSKLDAIRVAGAIGDIPQNVNFAIRGEVAKVFLAQHNVDFVIASEEGDLAPADLAEVAQGYTVLVGCLTQ